MNTSNSPFKFLEPYTQEDSDLFFGRDVDIEVLYEMTQKSKLILVYGQSGSGKTSLIQSGLSSKFSEADWLGVWVRRRNNINTSVIEEINKQLETPLGKEVSLKDAVSDLYLDYLTPVYLVFDQFEELFISGDATEQANFYQSIKEVVQAKGRTTCILVIREEYLAYLSDFEKVIPSLFKHRYRLEKVNKNKLEHILTEMLTAANIALEEGANIIATIVNKLMPDRKTEVEFSHLQYLLDKLYKKAKLKDGKTYFSTKLIKEEAGELKNVIEDFLAEVVAKIDAKMGKKNGEGWEVLKKLITDQNTKKMLNEQDILNFWKP
jgi:GTPase SAR1 family protein